MLYKYLSDNRLDVIKNLKIRFTQPISLNDPFEGLPLISTGINPKEFYKETKLEIQTLWESLDESEQTSENYKLMQSCLTDIKNDIKKCCEPSSVGELFIKKFKPLGILSLTKSPDNLLMWSHYANQHKGFVIGFDNTHDFFYETTISSEKASPKNVVYSTQRSVINNEDEAQNFYEKLYCEKPINWSYEEEVRIFRLFTDETEQKGTDENGLPVYLFDVPKDAIKEIYLGANTDPKTKKSLLESIKTNSLNIEIFETRMSHSKYNLEFTRLT